MNAITPYAANASNPLTAISAPTPDACASPDAGGPPSLLPEPAFMSGNAAVEIAMLMTKMNEQDRSDSIKVEDAADVAAAKDNEAQVQQLEDKANQDIGQGWVTGVASIVGGAASIGSVCVDALKGDKLLSGVLKGVGPDGTSSGIGKLLSIGYQAAGDRDTTDAAKYQAQTDADVRQYNRAQADAQAASEAIQQVAQYLQGILQTEQATNAAATGYRG